MHIEKLIILLLISALLSPSCSWVQFDCHISSHVRIASYLMP